MAARSLRCVAIAYRPFDSDKVPGDNASLDDWVLPDDDLVLLAVVGIKVYESVLQFPYHGRFHFMSYCSGKFFPP